MKTKILKFLTFGLICCIAGVQASATPFVTSKNINTNQNIVAPIKTPQNNTQTQSQTQTSPQPQKPQTPVIDKENQTLILQIENFLKVMRADKINSILPVDSYFDAQDNIKIKFIPTEDRKSIKQDLNDLEELANNVSIYTLLHTPCWSDDNPFLKIFEQFEAKICLYLE